MPAKRVAVDATAYEILRRAKRPGDSFSDAVRNLAGRHQSILDLAGSWSDVSAESLPVARAKRRRADRARSVRVRKE